MHTFCFSPFFSSLPHFPPHLCRALSGPTHRGPHYGMGNLYWTPVKRSAWGIAPGQSRSSSCCLAVVNNVPLHPIASLCMLVDGPLASVCPSCDRKVPMVLWATDEPIFFLSFVLPAACAHVQ